MSFRTHRAGGHRYRFIHVAVAALVAAAGVSAVGIIHAVGAAGTPTPSTFVPIVPCRLVDTRPGTDNVGPRSTPLKQAETVTFQVTGTNGKCTIPASATGIATNATAVHPTADSYVTIFPADATLPTASNLNVVAGSPPTPNQVTVGLSATGAVNAYNNGGTLDLIIDIVGYYQAAGTGPTTTTTPVPQTVTQYFSGDAVVNLDALATTYNSNNCITVASQLHQMTLALPLPIGAVIGTVQVRYVDQTAGQLNMDLWRSEPGFDPTLAATGLSTIGTNGTDFHRSDEFHLTNVVPVSSAAQYYVLVTSVAPTGPGAAVAFCGAYVTYTVPAT